MTHSGIRSTSGRAQGPWGGCTSPRKATSIDARKLERELGWKPAETFETGLAKTVDRYLDNQAWVDEVASGEYRRWVETNYTKRN
ncbi:hypothetical protein BCEP27_160020 [Burkholderia cepacia]